MVVSGHRVMPRLGGDDGKFIRNPGGCQSLRGRFDEEPGRGALRIDLFIPLWQERVMLLSLTQRIN